MKTPLLVSSSLLGGLVLLLAAAPAKAQDSTPPPAAPMSPPASSGSSGSAGGGGIGLGAFEALDPNQTFAQFVYDQSTFHLAGDLGYRHTSGNGIATSSDFTFAIEGWYHLAHGSSADFSIGGSAGLDYNSPGGAGASRTTFALIPGMEARLFVTQSFAFTGKAGIGFAFGDNNAPTT